MNTIVAIPKDIVKIRLYFQREKKYVYKNPRFLFYAQQSSRWAWKNARVVCIDLVIFNNNATVLNLKRPTARLPIYNTR